MTPKSVLQMYGLLAVVAIGVGFSAPTATAGTVGFDSDDFLVAGFLSDNIAVFDSDGTFKGNLDGSFDRVSGMDFDAEGRVVATGLSDQVRVYNAAGDIIPQLRFASPDLGSAIELKVGPNGNYYVGGQTAGGLQEFTPTGMTGREFAAGAYSGVAVLPGGVLWGGGFGLPPRGNINVFDIDSGLQTGTIPLDNGQITAVAMHYDPNTDTVLTVDIDSDAIYERDTQGNFIRRFDADGLTTANGITRGPGGNVFVTNQSSDEVFVWSASGAFLGTIDVSDYVDNPVGILYTGNIPEPASAALFGFGVGLLGLSRRRTV